MPQGGITSDGRKKANKYDTEADDFMNDFFTCYFYEPEVEEKKKPKTADPNDLLVEKVELDIKKNAATHHTDAFDITDASVYDKREQLVIRRGQEFTINIKFNRTYDAKKDDLRLIFEFGKKPFSRKGTYVEFILSDKDLPNEWGAYITSESKGLLTIVVTSPPTCAVGKWTIKIDVVKKKDKSKPDLFRYCHKDPIYILFNPWCKDDQVYMEEEKLLGEYILNETGKIYRGNTKRISPCPWNFGQFSGNVLDCAIYLLDKKSGLPDRSRGDAIPIVRKISSLINSFDNNGVLAGRWDGNYEGGKSPLSWTGSVEILEEFFRTKDTVYYGQCWVFSGVVTTVCRALGIPARSVTNFASAHDKDGSITIDTCFMDKGDNKMEKLDHLCDSVWNFHVWNEVWMARSDLPPGYGGWQAIDATPQETSEGVYCMGPVSLSAVKRGEVGYPYDGGFLFAEVNADRVTLIMKPSNPKPVVADIKRNSVGKYISTKRAFGRASFREYGISGDLDRDDVTELYKFREGSKEQAAAIRQASRHSTRKDVYEEGIKDVEFEIITDDNTFVGETVKLGLKMKNTTSDMRTVRGTIKISALYYTGVLGKEVFKAKETKTEVKGKEEKSMKFEIPTSDYLDKLVDHCMLSVACMFSVEETKQIFSDTDEVRLRKPHLDVQAPNTGKVGKEFSVTVTFVNPLPQLMTKCALVVEGPGLQKPITINQKNIVQGQKFEATFKMTPAKPGEKDIIVSFNSAQLAGVTANHPMDIEA